MFVCMCVCLSKLVYQLLQLSLIARMQTRLTNVVFDQVEVVFQVGRYYLSCAHVAFYNSGSAYMRHTQALLHTGNNRCPDLRQ